MITKDYYDKIKKQAEAFRYRSLDYVNYESIKDYAVVYEDETLILLYGYSVEDQYHQYHWACHEVNHLIEAMPQESADVLITFVPREWVDSLKDAGFEMYAVWQEYFADTLQEVERIETVDHIQPHEYDRVSEVTLACRGQSRGFSGQSTKWVKEWVEGMVPALPTYAANSTILVKRIGEQIIGAICIATYAHDSEKGAILWIREVAVHPDHQRKGIARELIGEAYQYGVSVGAQRAFLMADACNDHAIHLYESMGFRGNAEEVEITMLKER